MKRASFIWGRAIVETSGIFTIDGKQVQMWEVVIGPRNSRLFGVEAIDLDDLTVALIARKSAMEAEKTPCPVKNPPPPK